MEKDGLRAGAIVYLKSGGPAMIAVHVSDGGTVHCRWQQGNATIDTSFLVEDLTTSAPSDALAPAQASSS